MSWPPFALLEHLERHFPMFEIANYMRVSDLQTDREFGHQDRCLAGFR